MDTRYREFIGQTTECIWCLEFDEPIPTNLPEDDQIELFFRHGYIGECSAEMARLYGLSRPSQFVGTRLGELLIRSDPTNIEHLRRFIRSGYRVFNEETHELDQRGQERHFSNNIVGIVRDGRLIRKWGVQRDITAQKQTEHAFRVDEAWLESLVMMVNMWQASSDAITRFAVAQTVRLTRSDFGLLAFLDETETDVVEWWLVRDGTGQHEVCGSVPVGRQGAFAELVRDRRPFITNFPIEEVWLGGPRHAAIERLMGIPVFADQRIVALAAVANRPTPYLDAETRQFTLLMDSMWKLLRHRRVEEDLERARDAAESASRAKSSFLATMSHEIRTPLNGVIGMTELLTGTALSQEQQEYVEMIRVSGEALMTVLNDVLDFSKIESGRLELEQVEFDLRTTIEETVDLVADQAHGKGLEIACTIAEDSAATVVGDGGRLRQILLNLLNNAIKFTACGEIVLRATIGASSPDRRTLRVEVTDTGVGIDPAARERLFRPFSQADASTTRRFGGTGLGLAISKRLVELMGGEIGVSSDADRGSTFWFTAPFASGRQLTRVDTPRSLAGLSVLVVDDHATTRSILEQQLTSLGARAIGVDSGPAALDFLERDRSARQSPARSAHVSREAPPVHEILPVGEISPDGQIPSHAETPPDPEILPVGEMPAIGAIVTDLQLRGMDGLALAAAIHGRPGLGSLPVVLVGRRHLRPAASALRAAGVEELLAKPVRRAALAVSLQRLVTSAAASPGLPYSSIETQTASVHAPAHESAARPRVLVAEDNLINQRVAAGLLSGLGFAADVVSNGAEAVEAFKQSSYAAILMDCFMPVMDGFEATREIRRCEREQMERGDGHAGRGIPIVALTGNAMPGDREKCLAAGMDDHLAKPLSKAALAATLARFVPEDVAENAGRPLAGNAGENEPASRGQASRERLRLVSARSAGNR